MSTIIISKAHILLGLSYLDKCQSLLVSMHRSPYPDYFGWSELILRPTISFINKDMHSEKDRNGEE